MLPYGKLLPLFKQVIFQLLVYWLFLNCFTKYSNQAIPILNTLKVSNNYFGFRVVFEVLDNLGKAWTNSVS